MRRFYDNPPRPLFPKEPQPLFPDNRPIRRSLFPPEFDDPFGKRSYESSFYGGPCRDFELREPFFSGNLFRDVPDCEKSFGDNYSAYDYPDKMINRQQGPSMDIQTFFDMKNNTGTFTRRSYGKQNNQLDKGPVPQQKNRPQFTSYQKTDFRVDNNTHMKNNFDDNRQSNQYQEPVTKNVQESEISSNQETPMSSQPKSFPVRVSTEISVPGWDPSEQKDKYKVLEVKCKVCNITLTSKGVYEVHIRGKKHLKKEADAKKYSCDLCCTQMFTAEEQKAHNETEQHQESVKVAEFFANQRKEDPDIQKAQALAHKPGAVLTQSEIEAMKSASNDLLKYRCDMCNVYCNAQSMLDLHLSSKKHIKKANDLKLNSKAAAIQYSCEVCQFLCYSSEEHEAHSNSEEHAKALAEKYQAGTITAPAVPKDVAAACIPKDELDVVPERGTDNILWYNCTVCDVKTNSLENYKMHINSKKHKLKLTQPGAQLINKKAKYSSEALRNSYTRFVSGGGLGKKITGDPGSYCARCEIQFKTPQELEEHFLTLAHKNHNPYKKKFVFDNESSTKKTKLNNGAAVSSITQNKPPVPSTDYGYGNYEHLQDTSTGAYNNYSYPASYQTANQSAYYSNYQSAGTYGYASTAGAYTPTDSYNSSGYDYQAAYSTESNYPTSYSYSAPFYQH